MKKTLLTTSVGLAMLLTQPLSAGKKQPKSQPQKQEDVTQGCVTVTNIFFNKYHFGERPSVEAVVINGCPTTKNIIVTFGYFEGAEQYKDVRDSITLAEGARRHLYHGTEGSDDWVRMENAKVISVDVP